MAIIKANGSGAGRVISYAGDAPIIEENQILILSIKRTRTKDDKAGLAPHMKEGMTVRVRKDSVKNLRFYDERGGGYVDRLVIYLADEHGNVIPNSWIYAECLYL